MYRWGGQKTGRYLHVLGKLSQPFTKDTAIEPRNSIGGRKWEMSFDGKGSRTIPLGGV